MPDPESAANPYQLTAEKVLPPPTTLGGTLKRLGPGFVLSASIVGSGELIATTLFGAEVGFICLWLIFFSCLVKVAAQIEFGKFAIYSGRSSMQALNDLPGPKFGKGRAGWAVWSWFILMSLKSLQVGGIVGGVALALTQVFPLGGGGIFGGPVVWSVVAAGLAALIVFRGMYGPIEKWSVVMIGMFTILTAVSLVALQWTPFAITWGEISSGFGFSLPATALLIAIGTFSITGVGGDEILAYNYWLIEKGYAASTGPRPEDKASPEYAAWLSRAKGWIHVMKLDAVLSMLCYTLVTALFYLLGAAILHRQGIVPENANLIEVLSRIYTDTLGPWAEWAFLGGAVVVLFSTLVSALAAMTRLFSDAFGRFGWVNFEDAGSRGKSIAFLSILLPIIWTVLFFTFQAPGLMVIIGGSLTAIILIIVVYAALHMRYHWLPEALKPSRVFDAYLWLSAAAIAFAAFFAAFSFLFR